MIVHFVNGLCTTRHRTLWPSNRWDMSSALTIHHLFDSRMEWKAIAGRSYLVCVLWLLMRWMLRGCALTRSVRKIRSTYKYREPCLPTKAQLWYSTILSVISTFIRAMIAYNKFYKSFSEEGSEGKSLRYMYAIIVLALLLSSLLSGLPSLAGFQVGLKGEQR